MVIGDYKVRLLGHSIHIVKTAVGLGSGRLVGKYVQGSESAREREGGKITESIQICLLETHTSEIYGVGSSGDHAIRTITRTSYCEHIKSCKNSFESNILS
jgi:hypothetical protein